MNDRQDFLTTVVMCVFALALAGVGIKCSNLDAEERCKSMRRQGVPAFLSDGLILRECHVIGRELRE